MKLYAQELVADDLLGHMVIECLVATSKRLCERVAADKCCEVVLTVNGVEMQLDAFVKHWQGQVDAMIERKARALAHELVNTLQDDFAEMNERIRSNIEKYKFDWEAAVPAAVAPVR